MAELDCNEMNPRFGSQIITNMCSQLSGNALMSPILTTMKFPEQFSSKFSFPTSSEAESDSSNHDDSSPVTETSSLLTSMAFMRTLAFEKMIPLVENLLPDPSNTEEINDDVNDNGYENEMKNNYTGNAMFANTRTSSESDEEVQRTPFHSKFVCNLPLYQEYCLQDVRENIKGLQKSSPSELIIPQCVRGLQAHLQSCCTEGNRSVTLLSYSTPPPSTKPTKVTSSTLWQDLEEVKGSGLLQNLCSKEIRLHETAFELICSEASYLRSLELAVTHFYGSKVLKETLTQMEHHILFSNIQWVMTASEKFLIDLELRLGECLLIGSEVGDVVLRHCSAFQRLYVPYVTNMKYQEALISQLQQQNKDFQSVLSLLERSPVCQRQNLKSFLVLPFQRITRIKLILVTILRLTKKTESNTFKNLEKAIQAVHEVMQECDNGVQKMKRIEELVYLETHLDFDKVKSIPLVISGRFLIHQGPVKQLILDNSVHLRMSFTDIYLHLLSDMLIMSSKRHERFEVLDHAEFPTHTHCERFKAEILGLPSNSFLLHLSKRQTGPATVSVLVTDTQLAQERWIKVLSSME